MTENSIPAWLQDEVIDGFQLLIPLNLAGQPSVETIDRTMVSWCIALKKHPVAWDESRDAPRLREAFQRLLSVIDTWPQPRALLKELPPLATAAPEPEPVTPEVRQAVLQLMREFKQRNRILNAEQEAG